MKLAMIGLGKMGANMVRRLCREQHEVAVFDSNSLLSVALDKELMYVTSAESLPSLIELLPTQRVIWLMVPHQFVDETINELLNCGLKAGDLVVDGGNSNYKLSQKRSEKLSGLGIHFIDAGTSGGIWGLENGYSIMLGGETEAIKLIQPAIETLAPSKYDGWGHVGPAGAGHYAKMVHNGVEYGLMQAYAEGFELMQSKQSMNLDLQQISHIWQHGSVVRSWLLDLIAEAFDDDASLSNLSDYVDDSGEGRWTIEDSIENAIPTPVLSLALQMRFRSRQSPTFSGKVINAMRSGFGGHCTRNDKLE